MRVEVLGGVERRRRWSQDDKVRIVEETPVPGAKVSEVARRNGIAASVYSPGGGKHERSRRSDLVLLRCRLLRQKQASKM